MKKNENIRFGLCIRNDESEDIEIRKVYRILPDAKAGRDGYIRVVDESGEDYLYPESFFIPVRLPQRTQRSLAAMVL
jgi:signal transduction histidine kinase